MYIHKNVALYVCTYMYVPLYVWTYTIQLRYSTYTFDLPQ